MLSPLDALQVINFLTARFASEESEARGQVATGSLQGPVLLDPALIHDVATAWATTRNGPARASMSTRSTVQGLAPSSPASSATHSLVTATVMARRDASSSREDEFAETLEAFVEDVANCSP